jgi:K+-transporting ATPase ATPase A chain
MPVGVLLFTGITFALPETKQLITYQVFQAVTDIAYNFVSNFTNNGSNFAELNTGNNDFNYMTALAMFIGRYPVIYYSLAISASFASKRKIANCTKNQSSFDLSFFLLITVLIVGAIMFMPLMILGPILEFINM